VLEPDEGKLSSPVLRGLSGRKAARLPGEANRRDSFGWLTLGVRFRYSRLKEAALFAADAMGFQSTLVWKLLKWRVLAERPSSRSSSI